MVEYLSVIFSRFWCVNIDVRFIFSPFQLISGDIMSVRRTALLIRLKPEDREFVKRLAEYYDVAEADIVKMALREFIQKRKNENNSS